MPKFQRQTTHAHESDILQIIDDRFEELEETVALARLIPQLHDRLFQVETMLKRREVGGAEAQSGPQWSESEPPARIVMQDCDEAPDEDNPQELRLDLDGNKMGQNVHMKDVPTGLSPRSMAAHSPARAKPSKRKITEISRDKISDVNEQILDTQTNEYYTFGESTWDLVMFIGTGALGPLGSLQTFLLAVVNVMMQVVFVAIAYFNFTSPDINESSVLEAQRWRRASGHSLWSYDDVSKESLAERVCKLDKSLEQSGIQVALYENIEKYLKSDAGGLEGWFTGQVLCIVALVCWYLMVAKELSHASALLRGVLAMPTGPTRIDTRENPFTKATHYRLRGVARSRKVFSAVLFGYRLVAAAVLVFVGTFFLVYTVSVTELILNAVALGIILDIDDLLFDALATTPGRHLVHQLDALPMPSLPRIRGADAKSVSMSLAIPCLTILVYVNMLGPFVGTLQDVSTAMCGGNLGFVWNVDKRRVVLMAPTSGGGWEDQDETKIYAVEEGERIGFGLDQNDAEYGLWLRDVNLVGDLTVLSLAESIDLFNPECGDLGDTGTMLNYLRFFLQNTTLQGCADAVPFCNSVTSLPDFGVDDGKGWAARMLCSATCGCQTPASDNLFVQGCPYGPGRACQQSESFLQFRENSVCIEQNASSLRQFAPWVQWIEALTLYGNQSANLKGKTEALAIARAMWDHGCGFQANLSAENISWGDCFSWNSSFEWEFKTLEAFCPLTCGCSRDTLDSACPQPFGVYSCDQLEEARCLTWMGQHYCPAFSPSVKGVVSLSASSTDPNVVSALFVPVTMALMGSLAHYAGAETYAIRLDLQPRGVLILGFFSIFMLDPAWDEETMSSRLFSTPIADFEARVLQTTAALGGSINGAGLRIEALTTQSPVPLRRLEHVKKDVHGPGAASLKQPV
ncbi:unnamed protein product [Symbiodinium microadriaticum]|nr:unnamed protein product [Symbiodinium microadriaticum]CAE7881537.1 unnamed protein product [Symbiodinium sp. KB8]